MFSFLFSMSLLPTFWRSIKTKQARTRRTSSTNACICKLKNAICTLVFSVIHCSAKHSFPPLSIHFCSCDKDCYKKGSTLSFVCTRSYCYLTIIPRKNYFWNRPFTVINDYVWRNGNYPLDGRHVHICKTSLFVWNILPEINPLFLLIICKWHCTCTALSKKK